MLVLMVMLASTTLVRAAVSDASDAGGGPAATASPSTEPSATPGPSSTPPATPTTPDPVASPMPAIDERPDIIVIYVDDVPPLDGRLWTRARTPNIRRSIIDRGLTFRNAVVEAPLCCPARANLLTGRHTHNTRVTANDVAPFDPSVTIATELQAVGYHTLWIGKFLNRFISLRGAARDALRQGWDVFEPWSGGSYGYYYLPPGATRSTRPSMHSMDLLQQLARRELQAAPVDRPLFAVLSTYAGHYPNIALPRYRGSRRCATIKPWRPPTYGHGAATGKPVWLQDWVRRQAWRLPAGGYPLQRLCEDMLGVDELVGKVVREQRHRGRLDRTLLILASDNGYQYGEFGVRDKWLPWSVRVPLSMAWPAGMGTMARTTAYPTSNIDLAPTLCEIAGCEMGPFRDGQPTADGISLLPVMLDQEVPPRTVLLTQMAARNPASRMPPWSAVTTYPGHPLGRWHYIRWQGGTSSLYDLGADPYERRDLGADQRYAGVRQALERERRALMAEGRPVARVEPRPSPSATAVQDPGVRGRITDEATILGPAPDLDGTGPPPS